MKRLIAFVLLMLVAAPPDVYAQYLGPGDFEYPEVESDVRMSYGADSLQWGVLRVPDGPGPHPVVVMMHGGCWLGLHRPRHVETLIEAVTDRGWANWNLSHRQAVDPQGGWRGTFEDVGAGIDHLRTMADAFELDTTRVVTMGHAAGGHLAIWAGSRDGYEPTDSLYTSNPLRLAGAISLGGIPDLDAHYRQEQNPCGDGVVQLLEGSPEDVAHRYAEASPAERLPLGTPQLFLHGRHDYVVPWQQVTTYAEAATAVGDRVQVHIFEDASHFEVIAPASEAWQKEIGEALMAWLGALEPVSAY